MKFRKCVLLILVVEPMEGHPTKYKRQKFRMNVVRNYKIIKYTSDFQKCEVNIPVLSLLPETTSVQHCASYLMPLSIALPAE